MKSIDKMNSRLHVKRRWQYYAVCGTLGLWTLGIVKLHSPRDANLINSFPMATFTYGPNHVGLEFFDDPRNILSLAAASEKEGEYNLAATLYDTLLRRQEAAIAGSGNDTDHESKLPIIDTGSSMMYEGHHRAALCYQKLNDTPNAIRHAQLAYRAVPRREPFYYLAHYLDEVLDSENATHFYRLAAEIPLPSQAMISQSAGVMSPLDQYVYDIDIERDILWPRKFSDGYLAELQEYQTKIDRNNTLEDARELQRDHMVKALAKPLLEHASEIFRKEGEFQNGGEFYYSTPTIVRRKTAQGDDEVVIICRLINYRLDPVDRHYRDFLPPGAPSNVMKSALALHRGMNDSAGELVIISDDVFEKSHTSFMGAEDPKLFQLVDGSLLLSMTSWEYSSVAGRGARMASGILHVPNATLEVKHAFSSPFDHEWEKNWIVFYPPVAHGNKPESHNWRYPHVIYEWHPLRIGTMIDEHKHIIDFHTTIETPRSFRFLRGSSNGVCYNGQVWFMVHGVAKDYNYYHQFVVLDGTTFHVVQYTYPFKLEGDRPTEFCLGLDINPRTHTMTVAYSVMDGSSVLRQIPMWKIDRLMIPRKEEDSA